MYARLFHLNLHFLLNLNMSFTWGNTVICGVTERTATKFQPLGLSLGKTPSLSFRELLLHRQFFADSIRMPVSSLKFQRQVHGADIALVDKDTINIEADGMITNQRGIVLCVLIADCCAVLLYDEENQAVGAVHSGWRGTHLQISHHAIDAMASHFGTRPEKLRVLLSPCASGERYLVRKDVADLFPSATKQINDEFYQFDNRLRITQQLLEKGILQENIIVRAECTIDNHLFHSYRRDGEAAGRTAAYIGLK